MRKLLSLIAFLLFAVPAWGQAWSGVLSPARGTDWTKAGIPGGIPSATWTACGLTIAAYGSSGTPASPATIQTAIGACGANQYVQLGAGTFYLSGGFYIKNRQNVEVRGMGANSTFIVFSGTTGVGGDNCNGMYATLCIESGDNNYQGSISNGPVNWTAGYSAGTTVITLASVPNLKIGNPIMVDQLKATSDLGAYFDQDATTGGNPFTAPGSGGPYSAQGGQVRTGRDTGHTYIVTGCNGSTTVGVTCTGTNVAVTIDPPLMEPNWNSSLSPQAWWATSPSRNVGFQNMSIDDTSMGCSSGNSYGVAINNSAYFWVRGVKVFNTCRTHIGFTYSARGIIRDNYVHLARYSTSTSYGIECVNFSSEVLIENNISQAIAGPIILQEGCPDIVSGYNFAINDYYATAGYSLAMVDSHAVSDNFDLYEGNIGRAVNGDGTHGNHNINTFFRNRFPGTESACWASGPTNNDYASYLAATWGSCTNANTALSDFAYSRNFNIIGNVLGSSATANYLLSNSPSDAGNYVLNIGVGNNHQGAIVPYDPTVLPTTFLWGNCDYTNAGAGGTPFTTCRFSNSDVPVTGNLTTSQQPWAQTIPASHTLPASFYYSSKPSWWPSGKAWPIIGPDVTGGNISGVNGLAYTNPAEDCYNSLTGSTSNGTGGPFPFDANTCYAAASGSVSLSPSSEAFGSVNVGSSSSPQTFTVSNSNTITATSITPTLTGGNAGDFSITNTGAGSCAAASGSLANGTSCTFTATFTPTAGGSRSTTLSVSYSGGDGASPQTSALTGTGVSGSVMVTPVTLAFGTVVQGVASSGMSTTLTNNSGSTITMTGTSFTGTNASDFTASANTCNSGTVANTVTCTVTVVFTPTASVGTVESATLNIPYTGASGSPLAVTLGGTSGAVPQANDPVCTPSTGILPLIVSCTSSSSGTHMCYRVDGGIPATSGGGCAAGSTPYAGAFNLSSTVLQIVAGGTGYTDSAGLTYSYSIPVVGPSKLNVLVKNVQTQKVPITNSVSFGGETATIGPQTHTMTITTTCTCTVTTATGVVSGCVCPQSVAVTN